MHEDENDVRALMTFPREHRTKVRSTNPLERLDKEVKRRTDVVGAFPNDAAITRLVGPVLLEQNDERAVYRRYRTLENLAQIGQDTDGLNQIAGQNTDGPKPDQIGDEAPPLHHSRGHNRGRNFFAQPNRIDQAAKSAPRFPHHL